MRTYAILLATFFSMSVAAQTEVLVKAQFKPGKEYRQVTVSAMESELDITGGQEVMESLTLSGMTLPVLMKASTEIGMTISTSDIAEDGRVPATLNLEKIHISMETNGRSQDIDAPVKEAVVKGWYDSDNHFTFESATNMGGEINAGEITKAINQFQYMTDFPDKALKVGDSFTRSSPLNVPMPSMGGLSVLMETVFTVSEIRRGKVIFLTKIVLALDTANASAAVGTAAEAPATISGEGNGSCIYDISAGLITEVNTVLEYTLSMNTQGMLMKVKMTGTTKQTTTLQ